jgi:hypothetical protein
MNVMKIGVKNPQADVFHLRGIAPPGALSKPRFGAAILPCSVRLVKHWKAFLPVFTAFDYLSLVEPSIQPLQVRGIPDGGYCAPETSEALQNQPGFKAVQSEFSHAPDVCFSPDPGTQAAAEFLQRHSLADSR